MKKILLLCAVFLWSVLSLNSQTLDELTQKRIMLPNGWSLTSVGKQLPLGDLPLNMAVSHNKKLLAVTNNGQSEQSIELFDTERDIRLDSVKIPKSWYGLVFSANDQYLYASGGNDNWIVRYRITNGKLTENGKYILGKPWPERISPTGIALNEKANRMYVITKEDKSLYVFNLSTNRLVKKTALNEPFTPHSGCSLGRKVG